MPLSYGRDIQDCIERELTIHSDTIPEWIEDVCQCSESDYYLFMKAGREAVDEKHKNDIRWKYIVSKKEKSSESRLVETFDKDMAFALLKEDRNHLERIGEDNNGEKIRENFVDGQFI